MLTDQFSLATKNLRKRKLRSSLTIIGIVISIATLFVLVSLSLGLQESVEEQFRLLGTDKFFIFPRGQLAGPGSGGAVQFTIGDVNAIDKVSGVKDLSYFSVENAKVEFDNQIRFFQVMGIPADRDDVFLESGAYTIDEGRFLQEGDLDVVGIGSQYKYNNLYDKPISVRDTLKINDKDFKVKAIMQPLGNPGDDRLILMPLEDFRILFNIPDRIDQIVVQVNSESNINNVAERTAKKLRQSRGVDKRAQDFSILTPEEFLSSFGNVLNIITSFLVGVAGIALIVGGIGIANTMYTSVLERTREIGVMKAVGAKNEDILTLFLIESGILGLIGGILGVTLGIIISKSIEYIAIHQLGITLLQAAIPYQLILGCLLFAFLSGALSGILPAYQASRISTVEALRYE
ncbi:hypothetical protein COU54_04395 [Candidatus Pacearchaeota archaeon CG10_big_fil_rev_8_21_14_0_10_31_24]|nr:MAG: hypothetical protein COU54_04395 [Candidatus Pacearchaeota archaeon CG10_big_fil_rev_8_21_14_0_10_31_24]